MWRVWGVMGLLGLAMALVVLAAVAGFAAQACTAAAGPVGGIPGALVPVFQGAASRYALGPEGAAILAAINYEESDFGHSTLPGVRSGANPAGAAGPMQIGIGGAAGDTWDGVKVAAPGDPPGRGPDVYDEADAVYSAAHYLAEEGMTADPSTWQRAIYGYNHAAWYVQAVLSRAQAYYQRGLSAAGAATAVSWPGPQRCPVQAGSYANPFADVPAGHLVPERIDQGVDYADNAADPILALGDAVVTYAGPDAGWYGDSVNYTLADGPYAGRYVYLAESVSPTVHAGQHVVAGQEIATFAEPNVHGIETGWAAGPGLVVAKASTLGQQARGQDPGDDRSYCGNAFSALLAQLGAPPGLVEGRPVVGGAVSDRCYQPPRGSALAALRFLASIRACLRLSSHHWRKLKREMITTKKMITPNIALVMTTSVVSPYQPSPPLVASAAGAAARSSTPNDTRAVMNRARRMCGRILPENLAGVMHWGDGLECRQEGGIEPGSGDLEVVDRRFEDRCIEPCREALLLTGRDDRVLCRHDDRRRHGQGADPRPRIEAPELAPRLGEVGRGRPQELRDKPARELGVAQPAAAEHVSPQPVGRQREDQPQDPHRAPEPAFTRVLPTVGGSREHESGDRVGVVAGEELGDRASHRITDHGRRCRVEQVERRRRVGCAVRQPEGDDRP